MQLKAVALAQELKATTCWPAGAQAGGGGVPRDGSRQLWLLRARREQLVVTMLKSLRLGSMVRQWLPRLRSPHPPSPVTARFVI